MNVQYSQERVDIFNKKVGVFKKSKKPKLYSRDRMSNVFFEAPVLKILDTQSNHKVYENGAEYEKKVIRLAKAVKQDASCQQ